MKQSILWQITKQDSGIAPSYLLGTIHIDSPFAFANFDLYEKLILLCDAYAGESDLDELRSLTIPGQIDEAYFEKYKDTLSENQFLHLERFIALNLPSLWGSWMYLHPMLLLAQIEASILGNGDFEPLDTALWEFAKEQNKKMLAVESASMQHEIFKNLNANDSFRSVKKAISNLPPLRKKYQKLAQHYKDQNIQALYKTTKKELGKLKHKMIYERNIFMADRIEQLAKEQSTFIGIGVGHLSGAQGVLRLLKQKGFDIKGMNPIF